MFSLRISFPPFLFLPVLCLLWSSLPVRAAKLPESLVERSLYYARRIKELYPSDRYFVLNFGVSTNLISEGLLALPWEGQAQNSFRSVPLNHIDSFQGMNPQRSFAILEKLVPSQEVLAGRTLVFHRVLSQGWGLTIFHRTFVEFMAVRRPGTPFTFYLIGTSFPAAIEWFPGSRWGPNHSLLVRDREYAKGVTLGHDRKNPDSPFHAGPWLAFAPHEVERDSFSFQSNPDHSRFQSQFNASSSLVSKRSCAVAFGDFFSELSQWMVQGRRK